MIIYIATVFFAGLLSFFAPCTYPMIPLYIGILTNHNNDIHPFIKSITKALLFVAGLSTAFVTLGFGAGLLGNLIQLDAFYTIAALVVIVLGLSQTGLFKLPSFLSKFHVRYRHNSKKPYLSAYLLGFLFSFAWTPCVGPVLGAILVLAADGGQALYGALLMMVYTIGLAVPFIIMALASSYLVKQFAFFEKHLDTIKKIGGILIVFMGLLMLFRSTNTITIWFEQLFRK